MKEFTVQSCDNGMKLNKFLFKILPNAPQSIIYKSLRKKRIKINGKRVTDGNVIICSGDVIELYINDEFFAPDEKSDWRKLCGNVNIVYEDENIAVLNKPSGLPSQDIPGVKNSLESEFRAYLSKNGEVASGGAYIPSLCHRIDRNTSGLVIAAKNIASHRIISEKIKNKEIRKFYLCEVDGTPDITGEISGYIVKIGKNKFEFTERKSSGGKKANMRIKVIKTNNGVSLVEAELMSGRTHQIRAVMSYLGCPIIGDIKYGAKKTGKEYQHLKAYRLVFDFKTDALNLNYLNGREFRI